MALLRGERSEVVQTAILKKDPDFNVKRLVELDNAVRKLRNKIEELRAERNKLALLASGGVTEEVRSKSIEVGKAIKEKEKSIIDIEKEFKALALRCPNILFEDVPAGNKEANKVVKTWGEKPKFAFQPQNHLQLNESLEWFDFETAAKMSGAQFALYRKDAVKLMYALTRIMLKHNAENGFEPVLPPFLVNNAAMVKNGSLPKFEGDFYSTKEDDLSLIPTAEVTLTNMYADSILDQKKLPLRHTAWTSCFRQEAGGYGASERGLIRIHQFEKVELYSFCEPEKSEEELKFIVNVAEGLLQKLGLHYQVSLLAAQDTSFVSAKTYDLEVWLPGQGAFYEVSSCSNVADFQARRAKIRFRLPESKGVKLVHTLNGSSLALPRLVVALMETYQKSDGTIKLPDIIKKEMDFLW